MAQSLEIQQAGMGFIGWFIVMTIIFYITNRSKERKVISENKKLFEKSKNKLLENTPIDLASTDNSSKKLITDSNEYLIGFVNLISFKYRYCSKYFGEGIRRLIVILSILLPILIAYSIDQDNDSEIEDFLLYLLVCYVTFHLSIKIIIWIKEGFDSQINGDNPE